MFDMGKKEDKILSYTLIMFCIVFIGLLLFLIVRLINTTPSKDVDGFYQAVVENSSDGYRANFDKSDHSYYISYIRDNQIISRGTYEKYADGIFVLKDEETGDETLLTLLHKRFYYRLSQENKVIEFNFISNAPTYFE
jgi:hypothetical protein